MAGDGSEARTEMTPGGGAAWPLGTASGQTYPSFGLTDDFPKYNASNIKYHAQAAQATIRSMAALTDATAAVQIPDN